MSYRSASKIVADLHEVEVFERAGLNIDLDPYLNRLNDTSPNAHDLSIKTGNGSRALCFQLRAVLARWLQAGLRAYRDRPHVGEVRGIGLIGAIELVADPATRRAFDAPKKVGARLAELALQQGLIVRAMGDTIAFCPPLIITTAELDTLFDRFGRALSCLEQELGAASSAL